MTATSVSEEKYFMKVLTNRLGFLQVRAAAVDGPDVKKRMALEVTALKWALEALGERWLGAGVEDQLRDELAKLRTAAAALSRSLEIWHAGAGPEAYNAEHDRLMELLSYVGDRPSSRRAEREELEQALRDSNAELLLAESAAAKAVAERDALRARAEAAEENAAGMLAYTRQAVAIEAERDQLAGQVAALVDHIVTPRCPFHLRDHVQADGSRGACYLEGHLGTLAVIGPAADAAKAHDERLTAPLQARCAQLTDALRRLAGAFTESGDPHGMAEAGVEDLLASDTSAQWLKEHDAAVHEAGRKAGLLEAINATCSQCREGVPFRLETSETQHFWRTTTDEDGTPRGIANDCHAVTLRALAARGPR